MPLKRSAQNLASFSVFRAWKGAKAYRKVNEEKIFGYFFYVIEVLYCTVLYIRSSEKSSGGKLY